MPLRIEGAALAIPRTEPLEVRIERAGGEEFAERDLGDDRAVQVLLAFARGELFVQRAGRAHAYAQSG